MQEFIHLRLHSEFSVTDGTLKIKDIIQQTSNNSMFAISLTDLNNMFGFVKFYKACVNKGIKPILGAEVSVEADQDFQYNIILLAKNNNGLKILNQLISRSYIDNKIRDNHYIKESWLFEENIGDLIVLSGGIYGDIGQLIVRNKTKEAVNKARKWHNKFKDDYYIELHRVIHKDTNLILEESVYIAHTLNIAVVATHPIQFATASDYIAHEVKVCIADGEVLDDEKRISKFSKDQYFLSSTQMIERFSDIPSAIYNSLEIAKRCNVELTFGKYHLPVFRVDDGIGINEYLIKLAEHGLEKRLSELSNGLPLTANTKETYYDRLHSEIQTIVQMGFAGYFLIVADFTNWAKNNDIPVGPGRGSGAGSLVAFALGITDIEPLRYGLLFERFLNSERVSMPDFDIDFCQDKRELVIDYVKKKYGECAVSQIATFGTMSSKAVIKDVGRAFGLPYGLCDSISKLIINTPIKSYGLLEALEYFPELKQKIDSADEDLKRLWDMSLQLEDLTRNVGKHAAGVLIAPGKLTDFCPLYVADGMQTSQLDKDDVEQVGLVKFDFLGLRNLSIVQETLENIKELFNVDLKLSSYEFNDEKVYQLLQSGNTSAIFQLESPGMKRVLVKLAPDRFEDIIALLALYRPGPLGSGMVDDFIKRKKEIEKPNYFHDDLKACLESTYGVIVYQEQVMQISQIIGGYTLGGADLLRRAMGKKKPEEMAKHRSIFIEGALKKGYKEALAVELFDLMAKFAEYGFNKSHSAAYAVISYHTAYLKAHYISCFMAATLSSELNNTDKLYEFFQDCLGNKVQLLPPDINQSDYKFKPVSQSEIRYGLGAIKGVGKNIVDLIIAERKNSGKFKGFLDFCMRIDKKVMNKKTLESLVKAGCFDFYDKNRARYFNSIKEALIGTYKNMANENQASLFDETFDNSGNSGNYSINIENYESYSENLPNTEFWDIKYLLQMEKQALGYYYSGSLFEQYKSIVRKLGIKSLSTYLAETEDMLAVKNNFLKERPIVLACGIINHIGSKILKKGGRVYFINIEDDSSDFEFVLFNEEYEKYKNLIGVDEFVFVEGELTYDSFRGKIKISAKKLYSLDEILVAKVKQVILHLNSKVDVDDLLSVCTGSGTASIFSYYTNEYASCKLEFGEDHRLVVDFNNLLKLSEVIGDEAWSIRLSSEL